MDDRQMGQKPCKVVKKNTLSSVELHTLPAHSQNAREMVAIPLTALFSVLRTENR